MDRVPKLVAALALGLSAATAHAGYAWPADPPGFTRAGGQGFSGYGYAVNSANDQAFGRVVYQANGLKVPVPGKPVTMPAAYRFAANAPRVAAGILFANPALRTGLAIAAWLGAGKMVWDEVNRVWKLEGDGDAQQSTGQEWAAENDKSTGWHPTKEGACAAFLGYFQSLGRQWTLIGVEDNKCVFGPGYMKYDLKSRGSSCPAGWYVTPAGCTQTPPPRTVDDEAEFARRILNPDNQPGWPNVPADWPMPERVPFELPPGTPLPVDDPYINPSPGKNPAHRPQFVPMGDPVKNPNYNPNAPPSPENQPYIQPGVRINPSQVPQTDPFRLDLQPIDRPKPNGEPMTGPEDEGAGQDNSGDQPKPKDPLGLCEQFPDILACVKLDKPDTPDIPQSEKPISITPDAGWGADGGTCPPPRTLMVQGRQIPIPFDLFCTYMNGLRPIIIAMAWLSAAFILVGAREGD